MKALLPRVTIPPQQYETLEHLARETLAACRTAAADGTVLFRPDAGGSYNALWTRDFCYMVEGAGHLMDPAETLAAIDYLLAGQREDGAIPDRRQPDGLSVYMAGPPEQPLGDDCPADNAQFLVKALCAYARQTRDLQAFLQRRDALYRAMERVSRSSDGLVYVDPNRPHPGYGFADCVAMTGNVFMPSALHWEACHQLAATLARAEYHDEAHEWYERAEPISHRLGDFWDDSLGLFRAATVHCRQADLWGSAYACVVRVATKSQAERIANYFLRHADRSLLHGHLRHLPVGEYWQRLLADVPPDTYQNGGFWATPSGWVVQAVNLVNSDAARSLVTELVAEFTAQGIHEWISPDTRHCPGYVASIANLLGAVQPSKKLG